MRTAGRRGAGGDAGEAGGKRSTSSPTARVGAHVTLTARRQLVCALQPVGLDFLQILLLGLAIISLDILINLNYLIPFVNIAEFLATATSCDSDFHNLITKSDCIGRSVCFTCVVLWVH